MAGSRDPMTPRPGSPPSPAGRRPAAPSAGGAERRAHQRFDLRLAAELSVPDHRRPITAVTRDLSRGGACLESAYALPEGKSLEVALFVVVDGVEEASLPPLRVVARVQWCAQNDDAPLDSRHVAGIQFEGLTEAQATWLSRFLPAE